MKVAEQELHDRYALYLGDCMEVMPSLPDGSIHLSVYSPPFAGLYHYSSSERDLSNCRDYEEFFQHYEFVVREIARLTMPGRVTCVHCMDVPTGNTGLDSLRDFPGISSGSTSESVCAMSPATTCGRSRLRSATAR